MTVIKSKLQLDLCTWLREEATREIHKIAGSATKTL